MHLPMCPGLPGALTLALTLTLQEIDSKDERIGDLTNVRCKRCTLGALCKRPHDAPRLAGKLQATRGALQVCASIRPIPLKVTAPPPHMYIHYLPPHRVHRARTDPTPHRAATRLASPRLTSPHVTSALRGRTRPPPMRARAPHPRCRQVGGEKYSEPELDRGLKQRSSRDGCVQSADTRRDRRLAALAAHRGQRRPRGGIRCTSRRRGRDSAVSDGHEGSAPSESGEESKSSGGRHGVAAAARLRRVKRALGALYYVVEATT